MGEKKKKEEGPITVVLKVDMHCEGCARKVRHAVKGFEGIDSVSTDCSSNKLTVIGKIDPWKIRDRVEDKVHKPVALVSPNVPRKEEKPKEEKPKEEKKEEKKVEEKKPAKPPAPSTVVLKVRLHCDGCIQRIRKTISKIKGVEAVEIDKAKEEVTVKGTMDAKALPEYLTQKLKRTVTLVSPKKDGGGNGKKDEKKEDNKKDPHDAGKKDNTKKEEKKEEKKEGKKEEKKEEAKKMEYKPQGDFGGFNGAPSYGFLPEPLQLHAPQYFSDENPNACTVM